MTNPNAQPAASSTGTTPESRFARVAIGLAIGGLLIYWLGWTLLHAAMWIVAAIAIAIGVYAGYLAFRSKDANQRTGLWICCGGSALVAALVLWLIPGSAPGRTATWTYWDALSRIGHKGATFNESIGQPTTSAAAIDTLHKAAAASSNMADEIEQLPTKLVDTDAVALGADQMLLLHQYALITEDLRSLIEQDRQLQDASTSVPVLVASFVRGMFGDPLGESKDVASASRQLTGEGERIRTRWVDMQQRVIALRAQEIRLRSILSEKYGREFPPLSPSYKAKR